MQRQPQANYESPGRKSTLELFYGQSKLNISLKSPWLYLSLILLLWLLLL
jgi:hypothetical protein